MTYASQAQMHSCQLEASHHDLNTVARQWIASAAGLGARNPPTETSTESSTAGSTGSSQSAAKPAVPGSGTAAIDPVFIWSPQWSFGRLAATAPSSASWTRSCASESIAAFHFWFRNLQTSPSDRSTTVSTPCSPAWSGTSPHTSQTSSCLSS